MLVFGFRGRVSTDEEEQLNSYATQVSYYEDSISEGDMADGRYAELESRYLDLEGKVKKYRDEMSDRKRKAIAIGRFMDELKAHDGAFLEYSYDMFRGLCDRITIIAKGRAKVRFRSGIEVDVEY